MHSQEQFYIEKPTPPLICISIQGTLTNVQFPKMPKGNPAEMNLDTKHQNKIITYINTLKSLIAQINDPNRQSQAVQLRISRKFIDKSNIVTTLEGYIFTASTYLPSNEQTEK